MNGTENFVQPLSENLVVYEPSLALPAPWISESCIKQRINLNVYFRTSL